MTAVFLCFSITACSRLPDPRPLKNDVVSNKETVTDRLYLQYDEWKGTPYKMGGLSKNGVDCSGFVYLTYLDLFGKKLPRSARLQSRVGKAIKTDNRRSGDLVFFKTGWKVRHVGIYLENNSFLHASTKNGVMISQLDDPYWKSKYWQTKRVDFNLDHH